MDDISQRTKTGLKIRLLTDDKGEEVGERGRDRFGQRFVTERAQVLETFCPPRRDQEVGARVSIFSPGTEQRFSQFKQDVWCRSLFDLEMDDQSWKGLSPSLGLVSVSITRGGGGREDAKLLESVAFGEGVGKNGMVNCSFRGMGSKKPICCLLVTLFGYLLLRLWNLGIDGSPVESSIEKKSSSFVIFIVKKSVNMKNI